MSETGQSVNTTDEKPVARGWFEEEMLAKTVISSMVLSARAEANVLRQSENPEEKLNELEARIAIYEKESAEVQDRCTRMIRHVIAQYEDVYKDYRAKTSALLRTLPRTPSPPSPRESEVLQEMFGKSRRADLTKDEWYEYTFGRKPGEEPKNPPGLYGNSGEMTKAYIASQRQTSFACMETHQAQRLDPAIEAHSIYCRPGLFGKWKHELGLD